MKIDSILNGYNVVRELKINFLFRKMFVDAFYHQILKIIWIYSWSFP